ncbi:MAG: hypothetical protein JNL79_27045 [Myxococcales bacterium]|nr:hypothetical protein [Myxococcales bacterium]
MDGLTLESVLHVGASTAHYLAHDEHGVPHVVQILLHHLAAEPAAREALTRAGRVGLRLRHPARVPLLGMGRLEDGEEDGVPYLVHAFAPGEPLDVRLERDGPLELDTALRVAETALSVVVRAHRRGFVHGPLDLSKILVSDGDPLASDTVQVLECGATPWTPLPSATRVTKPDFWSEPRLDRHTRSDLTAVGLVLYSLLAGERVAMVTPRRDRVVQAVEQACDTHPFGARVERLLGRYLLRLLDVAGVPFAHAEQARAELDRIRALLAFADALAETTAHSTSSPPVSAPALAPLESGEHAILSDVPSVPPISLVRSKGRAVAAGGGALELVLDDLAEGVG